MCDVTIAHVDIAMTMLNPYMHVEEVTDCKGGDDPRKNYSAAFQYSH